MLQTDVKAEGWGGVGWVMRPPRVAESKGGDRMNTLN